LKLYEGMFILDDARCAEDYNGTVATVHDILTQQGAEIVDSRKWEERKLAYPIRRRQRGVYALIHFNAPPEAIVQIERQLRLATDVVLRSLIVVDEDGVSLGDEKEAQQQAREARKAAMAARESARQAETAALQAKEAPAPATEGPQEVEADQPPAADETQAGAADEEPGKDQVESEEEKAESPREREEAKTEEKPEEGP
jgi:small subunit ribosomal protein S6